MTFWKILSVCLFYSDENVNTVSGQNSNLWIIKAAGTQFSVCNKILHQFKASSFDRMGFYKQAITSSAVATPN